MRFEKTVIVLEKEIHIAVYDTGCGIQILIEGGDRGHIGAVSVASPDTPMQTVVFPQHKEDVISRKWAGTICEETGVPVVVSAGVHYDNIRKEQIRQVLDATDRELEECVRALKIQK
ncbi:MAG: hypothetical protein Q4C58_03425 [Eubacteriales bacterium]|nr:hypothetical protein [Eubacteriales bacterium]